MSNAVKACLAFAVIALAVGPAAASAGAPTKANVKITLELTSDNSQPAPDFFEGRVKSKRPACKRAGRPVRMVQNGNVVDTAVLDGEGEFKMTVLNPHPSVFPYTAKIKGAKRCKRAESAGVFAPG